MKYDAQSRFFDQLKGQLPSRLSLVNAVADLLELSTDSAYRRIRGETELSLREALLLSGEFGVSLDSLGNAESASVVFRHDGLDLGNLNYKLQMQGLLSQLELINRATEKKIHWFSKELPAYHSLIVPEVLHFKFFFGKKSLLGQEKGQFKLREFDMELLEIGQRIVRLMQNIPTVEILNEGVLSTTLKQIEYYHESDFFHSTADALTLLDKLSDLTHHIKSQAEHGFKYLIGEEPMGEPGNFQVYTSEILKTRSQIYAEADGMRLVYLEHNVVGNLFTADQAFCDYTQETLNKVLSKSTLISSVSERERNKFFRNTFRAIDKLKGKIESE